MCLCVRRTIEPARVEHTRMLLSLSVCVEGGFFLFFSFFFFYYFPIFNWKISNWKFTWSPVVLVSGGGPSLWRRFSYFFASICNMTEEEEEKIRNLLLYFALSTTNQPTPPKVFFPSICAAMWKEKWAVAMAIVYPWSIDLYRPFQVLLPISLLSWYPTWMDPSKTHNLHNAFIHPSIRPCFLSFC